MAFNTKKPNTRRDTLAVLISMIFKCTNFQFAQMNIEIAFGWIQTAKTTTYQTLWHGRKITIWRWFWQKNCFAHIHFFPFHPHFMYTVCVRAPYHCIMFNVNCNVCDEKQYVPNAYNFCSRKSRGAHTYTYQNISSNFVKITSSILHLTSPQWTKKRTHTEGDTDIQMCREQCVFTLTLWILMESHRMRIYDKISTKKTIRPTKTALNIIQVYSMQINVFCARVRMQNVYACASVM